MSNIRCRTFEEVLESNHPTLQEMAYRGNSNAAFVLSYITAAIISYLDFVGRRQTMDDKQVAETAELIFAEYPTLKFDDIALFIRLCKLSHFGKLYDLNGAVLLQWLHTYAQERSQANYERDRQEKCRLVNEDENNYNYNTPEVEQARERCLRKINELVAHTQDRKPVDKKADSIRRKVIQSNRDLLSTDPEHAFDIIEQRIKEALKEEI